MSSSNRGASIHQQSLLRRGLIATLLVMILASLPGPARIHAQRSSSLVLYPTLVSSNADLRVSAYDLPGLDGFDVVLELPDGDLLLGQVTSDRAGQVQPATVILPGGLIPGEFRVSLRNGGNTTVAQTSLHINADPVITVDPTSAATGARVNVRVENLITGTLRVAFGATTVLGPLPVTGPTYVGSFNVPDTQQVSQQTVTAINLVDGLHVGQASTSMMLQNAPPQPYTLRDIVLPTQMVKPGDPFVVTGRIDPVPPAADVLSYQVSMVWLSNGPVIPINRDPVRITTTGLFTATGQVPSLFKGDAITPKDGDKLQIMVVAPGNVALANNKWVGAVNLEKPVNVAFEPVKDMPGTPQDGATIPDTPGGALKVTIVPLGNPFLLPLDDLSNLDKAEKMLDIHALWDSPEDQQIKKTGAQISECWGRKFISRIPEYEWNQFEWIGNIEQAILAANPGATEVGLPPVAQVGQIAVGGGVVAQGARLPQSPLDVVPPGKVPARVFEVTVDATEVVDSAQKGYGFIENGNIAKKYVGRYVYIPSLARIFLLEDKNGFKTTEVSVPVRIKLPPLPPGWKTEFKLGKLVAKTPDTNVDGIEIDGSIYTFVDTFGGAFPPAGTNVNVQPASRTLELRQYVFPSSTGSSPTPQFTIDYANDGQGPIPLTNVVAGVKPASDGNCGSAGNPDRNYYSVLLSDAHRIPPGDHLVTVTITGSKPSTHTLHYVAPPSWFKDSSYLNRTADWSLLKTTLRADRFNEQNATVNLPSVNADAISNKPGGAVDNSAGGNLSLMQNLGPTGFGSIVTSGKTRTLAINNAKDTAFDRANTFGNTVKFGTGNAFQPIFDSGWLLVFQNTWGIPPIASASFSIKTQVIADLKYNGQITKDQQGTISEVKLEVNPRARVNVDGGLDASALFDFVEAGVHFLPSIGVNMPVTLVNGSIDAVKACFNYELRIRIYGSIGWEPFEEGFDTTKTILPYNEVCARLIAAEMRRQGISTINDDAWKLPAARPAIATDGLGTILSLWRNTDGYLVYQLGTAGSSQPLPGAQRGAQKPQLAFYAPNRAIAVWVESGVTPEESATITFEDAVKRQHLVWARWNGTTWSTPQRLTQPTTGDGSVALAGCVAGRDPACPAEGAMTAVWTHDETGDLAARNFRVYYATYSIFDERWDEGQPVDDTPNVTDHEPTLAFASGIPVVAWVRDGDRNLGTSNRQILVRQLTTPAPGVVQVPTVFQGRVASPALGVAPDGTVNLVYTVGETEATLSNQMALHVATSACGGAATCDWQAKKLTDGLGRTIYAEHPMPTTDSASRLTITYRSLGFGTSAAGAAPILPTDPSNVLLGELAQVEVNVNAVPGNPTVNPAYLTNGDAVYANAAALYDPLADRVVTLAARGSLPTSVVPAAQSKSLARVAWANADSSIVIASLPRQPDFVLDTLTAPATLPPSNQSFGVTARIRNDGIAWSGEELEIVATWENTVENGSSNVVEAGRVSLATLGAGASADVPLSITPPTEGFGIGRRLVVTVNPAGRIDEQSGQNNSQSIDMGMLSAPVEITADTRPGSPLVFLRWPASSDGRVASYRIYRSEEGGGRLPAGSSLTNGWVDLSVVPGRSYSYAVTSVNADGIEPAPSQTITVTAPLAMPTSSASSAIYLPLISSR